MIQSSQANSARSRGLVAQGCWRIRLTGTDRSVAAAGSCEPRMPAFVCDLPVLFDDFLPSWCIRRAPAWDNRSTRGVRRENLSKSGALQRIGIALSGIVIHRQTVD
jgi:hypothetical protein